MVLLHSQRVKQKVTLILCSIRNAGIKRMFAKCEGTKLVREGNFNFKLQMNVTNDVAKKASTENVLSKHEHCGDGEN